MPSQQAKRRSATTDGPVKRFRVSRACDQCRTERSKCDGHEPQCGPCFDNKRACTFTSNPRKRGLPPGYIRTIELALAIVFQENADIENALIARLAQPNTVLLARDSKDSNKLHKTWRKTKFCRSLNKALTGGETPENEDDNAPSSDDENDADSHGAILASEPRSATIISPVMQFPPTSVPSIPGTGLEMQTSRTSHELTPLPPNCWKLIETYAIYTQCWLPISEKLDILKLSYSYPNQGLSLSPSMPDAGHHAEMWSIFALGALQELAGRANEADLANAATAKSLYAITQTLIPDEHGSFQLGHVKAILNLAIFNISRQLFEPAWILVGAASRILFSLEETPITIGSRRPHVLAGCFVLDSLLAQVLDRPAYLTRQDLEKVGRIEEDGLEEWQPWAGDVMNKVIHQSQSPTLAFSTFNNLVTVTDILSLQTQQSRTSHQDTIQRFETWKASLHPKFDYIRIEGTKTPATPPALLLQLASFTASFTLSPAPLVLQRIFDLMNNSREQLGFANLPSVSLCLLRSIQKSASSMSSELRNGIDRLVNEFSQAQARISALAQNLPGTFTKMSPVALRSPQAIQVASPQAFQHQPPVQQQPPARHPSQAMSSSLLNDLLPDMNPNTRQAQPLQPFDTSKGDTEFTSPGFDPYDPSVPGGDLDSFFDELAYLHGAKKIQNQGQFMENLGFAPEISMADLLATQSGQFVPMHPAFSGEQEGAPIQFPLNEYYDIDGG